MRKAKRQLQPSSIFQCSMFSLQVLIGKFSSGNAELTTITEHRIIVVRYAGC